MHRDQVQIELRGQVVARSKNLRGVLTYARAHPPTRVELTPLPGGEGSMRVSFSDGATTRVNFASLTVLREWVKARRSWTAPVYDYAQAGKYSTDGWLGAKTGRSS